MAAAKVAKVEAEVTDSLEIGVAFEEVRVANGKVKVTARITVETAMPEQNERLPHVVEKTTVAVGQEFMREYYRNMMERADLELILRLRSGNSGVGIRLMGKRRYTIKTVFGTVPMKRTRIRHKGSGITEIPSAKKWGTPKQILITDGLKNAVCDLVVKQSFSSTLRQLEAMTGERKIVSKSSIGNILHEAGEKLAVAEAERAQKVYDEDEEAKRLLGRAESYIGDEFFEQVYLNGEEIDEENIEDLLEEIEWDPRERMEMADKTKLITNPEVIIEPLRQNKLEAGIETDLVIVEPDEVVTRSQSADTMWLINYAAVVIAAVVIAAGKTYYFSAISSTQLLYEVGSLLATLGVDRGNKGLLVISDGAAWIRRWIDSIGIVEKTSVLCWYHLKKRCWRLIREAIKNKEDRLTIKKELLKYLWRGQVEGARKYLTKIMTDVEDGCSTIEVIDIKKIEVLREYLLLRELHIPDYLARVKGKQWIANTKIEKFNDWSVAVRCKKQNGMRWSKAGVGAIAALETARRNEELEGWRESGKLTNWEEVIKRAA
jgi:hypothetical protein